MALSVGGSSLAERLVGRPALTQADHLVERGPEPPVGWSDPWLVGAIHEQAVGHQSRRTRGAWYTPEPVVRGLVDLATADGWCPSAIIDPTCGGGGFLLAALDRSVELGLEPIEALARVSGLDIDELAVAASRWSVALWAAANGIEVRPEQVAVGLGDALEPVATGSAVPDAWPGARPVLVIGNPPFATPLRANRLPEPAERLRAANGDLLGPYGDLAAIHLLAALSSVPEGSVVALILPQSVLAGRDTAGLRHHCDQHAPLQALWVCRESVFDAGVRACAVVLRVGGPVPDRLRLADGPTVEPVERSDQQPPSDEGRWAGYAARALGAPALPPRLAESVAHGSTSKSLGDLVTATAGFRDEYYGLVDACREWSGSNGSEPNRLATVGTVDPLHHGWGQIDCRLGGTRWVRPVVDLEVLAPEVCRWVEQRLVPKVVLATQSRLLEPVIDRTGRLVPSTPLIAVTPRPETGDADGLGLERIAAVLLAPPVVAWAWQRWFGSALSVDALKLAARQVAELPLPDDRSRWDEAARMVASLGDEPSWDEAATVAAEVAEVMNQAYGADPQVLEWWRSRRGRGPGAGR